MPGRRARSRRAPRTEERSAPMPRLRPRTQARAPPSPSRAAWRRFRANPMTVPASKPPGLPACWRPRTERAVAQKWMARARATPRLERVERQREKGPTTGRWAPLGARSVRPPTWRGREQWARSAPTVGPHPMSARARAEQAAGPQGGGRWAGAAPTVGTPHMSARARSEQEAEPQAGLRLGAAVAVARARNQERPEPRRRSKAGAGPPAGGEPGRTP